MKTLKAIAVILVLTVILVQVPVTKAVITSYLNGGLLAYYSLDQKDLKTSSVIADKSGSGYNGTITAGAGGFAANRFGQPARAYDFDGANTKIDTGSDWIGTQAVTVSAWIYLDGYGEFQYLGGGRGAIITNNKFYFFSNNSEGIQAISISSNGTTVASSANGSIQLNTWYHVAVTRTTGGTANLYVNGVLSGAANQSSGTPAAGTTNVIIGNRSDAIYSFDGIIDELKIFNKVLTAGQIREMYQEGRPVVKTAAQNSGLIASYSLAQKDTKAGGAVMQDLSGNNYNGTITGATFTTDRKGQANKAMSFNGTTDYINAGDINSIDGATALSVFAWIKIDDTNEDGGIASKAALHNQNQPFLFWRDDVVGLGSQAGNTDAISVLVYDGDTQAWSSSPTGSLNDTNWHFVGFTFTANVLAGLKPYVDGVSVNSASTVDVNSIQASTNNLIIGSNDAYTVLFDGSISDVRIYNRALSAAEIAEMYRVAASNLILDNGNLLASYSLASKDTKAGGAVLQDISGNGHDGTITAGASAGFQPDQKGQANRAYDFDNANTIINTGSDWIGTQVVTVAAWIYLDGYGEGPNLGKIVYNNKFGFGVASVTNRLELTNDGSATKAISAPNSILTGNWYHVAVTRSGTTANLYINGALSGDANQIIAAPVAGTTNVIIGNSSDSDRTFDGRISNLKVWDRVLSAAEIMEEYKKNW